MRMPALLTTVLLLSVAKAVPVVPQEPTIPCHYQSGNFSLNWRFDDLSSDVIFTLKARSDAENFWSGVYFGDSKPEDVIGVFVRSGQIGLIDGHFGDENAGQTEVLTDADTNVQSLSLDSSDGWISAEFSRPLKAIDSEDSDLSECTTFFVPKNSEQIKTSGAIYLPKEVESFRVCDIAKVCSSRQEQPIEVVKRSDAEQVCSFEEGDTKITWKGSANGVDFTVNTPTQKGKKWSAIGVGESMSDLKMAVVFTENGKPKQANAFEVKGYQPPHKAKGIKVQLDRKVSKVEDGHIQLAFHAAKNLFAGQDADGCVTLQIAVMAGNYAGNFNIRKHEITPTPVHVCNIEKCGQEEPEDETTQAKEEEVVTQEDNKEEKKEETKTEAAGAIASDAEGSGETAVKPEESSEKPDKAGESSEKPEKAGESAEKPEKAGESAEKPEKSGESSEKPEKSGESTENKENDLQSEPETSGEVPLTEETEKATEEPAKEAEEPLSTDPTQAQTKGEAPNPDDFSLSVSEHDIANIDKKPNQEQLASAEGNDTLTDEASTAENKPLNEESGEKSEQEKSETAEEVPDTDTKKEDETEKSSDSEESASHSPAVESETAGKEAESESQEKQAEATSTEDEGKEKEKEDVEEKVEEPAETEKAAKTEETMKVTVKPCGDDHVDLRVCEGYFADYLTKVDQWAKRHNETVGEQMWKACSLLAGVNHVSTMCCTIFHSTCEKFIQHP